MSKRPAPKMNSLEKVEAERAAMELAREKEVEETRASMLKLAEDDCESVGFDFDDISWDDANAIADILSRQFVASEEDDKDALEEAREEMRGFLARIVTHVPNDWFVSSLNGATKDFSNPDLYRSLKATKSSRLVSAMNYALEQAQKN